MGRAADRPGTGGEPHDYDVVIVGASLAGSAAAILLGRQGARVALVDRRPDPRAFKRTCTHFIQASAVPTLERLDLLGQLVAAGAIRSRTRMWTSWGWIEAPAEKAAKGINLRRELLDPILRDAAAATPGVELALGRSAHTLLREGATVRGVVVRGVGGEESEIRGRLVVGADGRDSPIAELAGIATKTPANNRFLYAAHFEGVEPPGAPNCSIWILDPDWAAVFPTDSGLALCAALPTKERLPEFRRYPEAALLSYMAALPEAPPVEGARRVGPLVGKLDMTNRVRRPVAPGLALVGDAALASDPLFGVGCGWAFQSAEWLADSVAPALRGEEPLARGLRRYRRRHARELRGHTLMIHANSRGRRLKAPERMIVSAAARDPKVAAAFDAIGSKSSKPGRVIAPVIPRAIAVSAKHALSRRR